MKMEHETVYCLLPAFAIGATDAAENQQVVEHLRRCAVCRNLLAAYQALNDDLLYAIAPTSVVRPDALAAQLRRAALPPAPPTVWGRLMAGWRGRGQPAWVALAIAVLLLAVSNVAWWDHTSRVERRLTAQAALLADLSSAPSIALRADVAAARGVVYAPTAAQQALLCVYDLPTLPVEQAYQVWLIKDGRRESGGVFQVTTDGYGVLVIPLARPLTEYDALGITVEPAGGSPSPTTPRVMGGQM